VRGRKYICKVSLPSFSSYPLSPLAGQPLAEGATRRDASESGKRSQVSGYDCDALGCESNPFLGDGMLACSSAGRASLEKKPQHCSRPSMKDLDCDAGRQTARLKSGETGRALHAHGLSRRQT
jgi:hypothetical protein